MQVSASQPIWALTIPEALEALADGCERAEEFLRAVRAYDRLREAAGGDDTARADEKRVLQARRAIERAIRALDGPGEQYD